ncbi:MAG TPA: tetratricopeptide repeat protein [Candidatus Binatia bacterium]|nr:tetratricopeptide repeat protein [Candidatus Binatia bacterium]
MSRPGRPASRLVLAVVLAAVLAAPAALAQTPPPLSREQALARMTSPDVDVRRRAAAALGETGAIADAPVLLGALRDPDQLVRSAAEQSVWKVWSRSGDPEVDRLFARGLEQMSQGAGDEAIETFTRIIQKKPDFAEGWNKRATVYFLMGDYDRSLRDCDEVMRRNPSHFGALAGYGQIYLRLGQPERALEHFERALAVNPNLAQVELVIDQLRGVLIRKRKDTT